MGAKLTRSRGLRLTLLALAAAGAAGLAALLIVSPWDGDERASGEQRTESAANDEEWIELIQEAKRQQGDAGKAPPPHVPDGVTLVDTCSELPATVVATQRADEPDPDGTSGRSIHYFSDSASANPYMLVVRWEAVPDYCVNETITRIVRGSAQSAPRYYDMVDQHICDEMALMARGEAKTDQSLRDASPAVAQEYLKAFCDTPRPGPVSEPS